MPEKARVDLMASVALFFADNNNPKSSLSSFNYVKRTSKKLWRVRSNDFRSICKSP